MVHHFPHLGTQLDLPGLRGKLVDLAPERWVSVVGGESQVFRLQMMEADGVSGYKDFSDLFCLNGASQGKDLEPSCNRHLVDGLAADEQVTL